MDSLGLLPSWHTSDSRGGPACVQSSVNTVNCDCAVELNGLSTHSLALSALAVAGTDTHGTQKVARDAGVVIVIVHPVRCVGAGAQALVGEGCLGLLDHQTEVPASGAHPVPLSPAAVTLLVAGPADLAGSLVVVGRALREAG